MPKRKVGSVWLRKVQGHAEGYMTLISLNIRFILALRCNRDPLVTHPGARGSVVG
jgi:hypothetical protein